MRLSDIINKNLILTDMEARNNNEAIQELVELLVEESKIPAEFMTEALLSLFKREALGSTGIGSGVAIPHGRVPFVQEIVGAFGISKSGLNFRSVDGAPVDMVFLFLSPEHKPDLHLKMMAMVSSLSRSLSFLHSLREADSLEEVHELIEKAETLVYPKINEEE